MSVAGLSRRGFVRGLPVASLLVGSPAVGASALGCRAPGSRAREGAGIEVAAAGQDPTRGHVIRDGATPTGGIAREDRAAVVIVGAGVAGLSAAWALRRAGIDDVVVLELEDVIGGTARGGELARSAHPLGAHYLPMPAPWNVELWDLLDDLGMLLERTPTGGVPLPSRVCAAPVERHYMGGLWAPGLFPARGATRDDLDDLARFEDELRRLDGLRDGEGRRAFVLPLRSGGTSARKLDGQSAAAWLDQLEIRSPRVRWWVEYGCIDDHGTTLEDISAYAAAHHFVSRGFRGEHEDGAERSTLVWPDGNASLVRALAAHSGARILTGRAVTGLAPERGEMIAWDVTTNTRELWRSDVVLWAAPRFVLRHLLGDADPLPAATMTWAPWVVVNVEVETKPAGIGAPLAWDNVPVELDAPLERRGRLGYVVATHGAPSDDPRPGTVLSIYEALVGDPIAARRRLLEGSDADWLEHALRHVEGMHPRIRDHATAASVARWGHGMIRPTPGLCFGGVLDVASAPIGKVLPCSSDTSGLALFEEAFHAGLGAAHWAVRRLG